MSLGIFEKNNKLAGNDYLLVPVYGIDYRAF